MGGEASLFQAKRRAGEKNCMQAHSTVVVVSETVLSICPRAVLRRRFFDTLQLLKALKRLNGGVEGLKEGVTDAFLTRFFMRIPL